MTVNVIMSVNDIWKEYDSNFSVHQYVFLEHTCTHLSRYCLWLHLTETAELSNCNWDYGSACMLCRVQLFVTPWTVAHLAPLSMRFPRQEYWSGLPFPAPGDLPDPGMGTHIFCVSYLCRQILNHWTTLQLRLYSLHILKDLPSDSLYKKFVNPWFQRTFKIMSLLLIMVKEYEELLNW